MGLSPIDHRLLLTNATPDEPLGRGLLARKISLVKLLPYQAAHDLWLLDEMRIKQFARYGISNRKVERLHAMAGQHLADAEKYLERRQYDRFLAASYAAWGLEAQAYPEILATLQDAVKSALFFLALLVPFAYFAERLLFAFPTIEGRIAGTFGIVIVLLFIFRYIHPAFYLALTPLVILLAFIILVLSITVISIAAMKFERQVKEKREERHGVHTTDFERASAIAAALTLGVSNMRKRGLRTALTTSTLVLLAFTVISFTSIKTHLKLSSIPVQEKVQPPYTGLLFRDRTWSPMTHITYKILENEFPKSIKSMGKTAQALPRWLA